MDSPIFDFRNVNWYKKGFRSKIKNRIANSIDLDLHCLHTNCFGLQRWNSKHAQIFRTVKVQILLREFVVWLGLRCPHFPVARLILVSFVYFILIWLYFSLFSYVCTSHHYFIFWILHTIEFPTSEIRCSITPRVKWWLQVRDFFFILLLVKKKALWA